VHAEVQLLEVGLHRGVDAEQPVQLGRPPGGSGGDVDLEAAEPGQALRLGEPAAVLLRLGVQPLPLRDVAGDRRGAQRAVLVLDGRDGEGDVEQRAVLAAADGLQVLDRLAGPQRAAPPPRRRGRAAR
jgi:hypothetical protein